VYSGSTVVLTGVGAKGQVGEAVARAFADLGASLVLVDRTADKVQERVDELTSIGKAARGYACDLTNEASVASLVQSLDRDGVDRVNALVHMAGGFAMSGPVAESELEVWQRQISINLTTAYLTTRAFLPLLRPARGAVVYFASEAALPSARPTRTVAYTVAKSGVLALMRVVAEEEREHNVCVVAMGPGAIRTAANQQTLGDGSAYVEREDVASAVLYLCSDKSRAVTGQVVQLGPRS